MRIFLIVAGIISGLLLAGIAVIVTIGNQIESDHAVTLTENLPFGYDETMKLLTDPVKYTEWNPLITSVEIDESSETCSWKEVYENGSHVCFRQSWDPETSTLKREVTSEDAPFQVVLTIQIKASSETSSQIIISEAGAIPNPLLRFIAHRVVGVEALQQSFISSLQSANGNKG
ncbi:MAG: hypothetical protein HRU19_10385 [Pseudobacteriovorax sp.]|nr:hypothetical protein [Pseudobacteriovorax sp.]